MEWSLSPMELNVRSRARLRFGQIFLPAINKIHRGIVTGAVVVWGPLLAVTSAVWLWQISFQGIELDRMTDLGLVSVMPPLFYIALAVLTGSFTLLVFQPRTALPILLLHLLVLIFMIHGTPIFLEGNLRYSWAWKHLGIVDYIQRHGSVNPHIAFLNVYHNWPGFFAFNALLTSAAGFKSALPFAGWAPVFFNLLDLGALLLIFKTATDDLRLISLSLWFFYLTNWVGQDYFSPQAMSYFLYLVIVGILLKWFSLTTPPPRSTLKRWLFADWLASIFHSLVSPHAPDAPPVTLSHPWQRVVLMITVILLIMVVASTHQLTPFMIIGAITALVVFQRCNARSLPILATALTMSWIVYMAEVFMRQGNFLGVIQSLGKLFNNVDTNFINLTQASAGQQWVALMGRSLTALVGGLACLGGLRRWRHGHWDPSFILLALIPFFFVAANSYGGEMLFRIYFFALPFMAFFAATLLYPSPAAGTSRWTVALSFFLSLTLLAGFCFAYYGKERMFYFSNDEVTAAQYLYNTAPDGSLLIDGSVDYPWAFRNYEYYSYLSLADESRETQMKVLAQPVTVLADWMSNKNYPITYLIITRAQKANINMIGLMPAGALERIERALLQSPRFKVVYANKDTKIFTLAGAANWSGP